MNERLGVHYQRRRGLDNAGLRFTTVYDYGKALTIPRGTGVDYITELLEKTAVGEPGVITNGNDVPDWLYVEDVARAVRLAADAPPSPSPGLTICGDTRSMQEVVACVRQLLPEANLRLTADRPGIVANYDPSVTEAAIGYSRQFSMEEGFRKTINAVRAKHGLPAV